PHGARLGRLRPGIAGAQPEDAVLDAPAVVERDRHFAPRIAAVAAGWHPVDELGRIHGEPLVEQELVEQPRLLFQKPAKAVALGRIVDGEIVALPAGKVLDQPAIIGVVDVVGGQRWIVLAHDLLMNRSWLAHGSRRTTSSGCAFISRFHSRMYSRMKA